MNIKDECKALIAKIESGQWVTTTLHELKDAVKALIREIEELEHGHQDQAEPQGQVAQEAGHSAGREDSSGGTGEGGEEQESRTAA